MSVITNSDIKKIAKLAHIKIDEEACENFATQIDGIIKWVEQLNEVETSNVDPLYNPNQNNLSLNQDVISDGNIAQDVLRNTKNAKYNYFSVPKVIE